MDFDIESNIGPYIKVKIKCFDIEVWGLLSKLSKSSITRFTGFTEFFAPVRTVTFSSDSSRNGSLHGQ
jgi:hypothetical protein